jgi:hypothetical protein
LRKLAYSMDRYWPFPAVDSIQVKSSLMGRQQLKPHPWMQVPVLVRKPLFNLPEKPCSQ